MYLHVGPAALFFLFVFDNIKMETRRMLMKAITVKELTKKYKEHVAVDHLSFEVEKGELFAFLGENGAGKSTTINIL